MKRYTVKSENFNELTSRKYVSKYDFNLRRAILNLKVKGARDWAWYVDFHKMCVCQLDVITVLRGDKTCCF